MKQPIIILSSLLCICGIQGAFASDSAEEITPVAATLVEEELVEENEIQPSAVVLVEEEQTEEDNVQLSDSEYIAKTMDEIAEMRARVNELLIPKKSAQNLWTEDLIVHNSEGNQSVVMPPKNKGMFGGKHMKHNSKFGSGPAFSLGDQSYYGETVYIINNFLSKSADNISETSESYVRGQIDSTDELYFDVKLHPEFQDCPFDTKSECAIWLRKPVISETVAPRSMTLRDSVMYKISSAIEKNPNVTATDKAMAPLLERYRVLMRASQSCCTGGLTYKLQKAGASQKLIYKFLSDDANFTGFSARCVVMDDEHIAKMDEYEATAATVADVRNGCICKSKYAIEALLAPFDQLYQKYPEFAKAPFEYEHHDGLGRLVLDSINIDVQNVLNQLKMCP